MGKIRGTHSSPGIYTRNSFDLNRVDTRNSRKGSRENTSTSGGGGGGHPTSIWVLGDELPGTLY